MDVREKLVEIIRNAFAAYGDGIKGCTMEEFFADFLAGYGVTVQEWIPTSERLPDEEWEVLLYDTEYRGICMGEYRKGNKIIKAYWFVGGHSFPVSEYTQWMTLPKPPKGE